MKKLMLLALVCFIGMQTNVKAENATDFSFDETEFHQEMSALTEVEQIAKSQGLTYHSLQSHDKYASLLTEMGMTQASFGFEDIDWGSFAWGFCCWPVGFFVVAINKNKDSDQKLSFWIGVITSAVVGGLGALGTAGGAGA